MNQACVKNLIPAGKFVARQLTTAAKEPSAKTKGRWLATAVLAPIAAVGVGTVYVNMFR